MRATQGCVRGTATDTAQAWGTATKTVTWSLGILRLERPAGKVTFESKRPVEATKNNVAGIDTY